MKNKIFLILIICIFSGCQNAKDGFIGTKNNNSDEFLVEKKNPLILPPDFTKLPIPESKKKNSVDLNKNKFNLKSILENKKETQDIKKKTTANNSLEKLILENIARD